VGPTYDRSLDEPDARTAGVLFLAGAMLSGLGVLLPHSREADIPGFLGIALGAGLIGLLLVRFGHRMATSAPVGAMLLASCLVGLSLVFNGERHGGPSAGNEVLFLWVALYAGYYFRWSALLLQLAVIACVDAAALAIVAPGDVGYTRWLITTGGAALAGVVVHRLRRRNDELVGQLIEAGRTDQLTGLVNRRGYEEAIEAALARGARSGTPVALVLADLDRFKQLNDSEGHLAGDEALTAVGGVLTRLTRLGDTAARLGGDEFAVILAESDAADGLALAERLRAGVSETKTSAGAKLSVSVGIATAPTPCQDIAQLARAADLALYAAKRAGGDRAEISTLYSASPLTAETIAGAAIQSG
jgi:diguanylate cyclase (GGDEF)-like protein